MEKVVGKYKVQQKSIPLKNLWQYFPRGWKFLNKILHAYIAFLSMQNDKILSNYLKLWQSYAILDAII